MKCPKCQAGDTKVLDSRVVNNERSIRRRRVCDACSYRFTTFERVESGVFVVVKKDGIREPYDREKLERGILRACTKRPVKVKQVHEMLLDLEEKWSKKDEVPSEHIGAGVMEKLKALDEVAYIRFASVYKRFEDINEFQRELGQLLDS